MLVRKCYHYRLYPTNSQAEHLQWVLDRCRELYNAALQERRDAYRLAGVKVSYYAQKRELPGVKEHCPELKQAGAQVLQDVLKRPVPKTLSKRWHTCAYEDCGLSLQRDHNSARELLNRAGLARAVAAAPAAESHRCSRGSVNRRNRCGCQRTARRAGSAQT